MNILPKKRWHVRNRDNKERVRRDEENARLEQIREEERIALAEQEARLALLRGKNNSLTSSSSPVAESSKHINLFAEEEKNGQSSSLHNEEYVKEKKLEREEYEKKIGLLTYVGQSSIESKKSEQLWYLEKRDVKEKVGQSQGEIRKEKLDPLVVIHKHLPHKKAKEKKKKKKRKKERSESPPKISKKSLEELREERLKRERKAQEQEKELLYGKTKEVENPVEADPHRYNSQFNPHLVRKRYRPY